MPMPESGSENKTATYIPAREGEAPASAPPDLADFEIIKRIGSGTFGQVWIAKERITGVYRAIKTFPQTAANTEITGLCEYQRRALNHPQLISIHLVGQRNQTYYVVMELADDVKGNVAIDPKYYESCSLQRLLQDRGPLPPGRAMTDFWDVLQGIHYLHQHGLVHRDIKPSNILYVNGRVRLSDFGLIAPGHQAVDRAGTSGYWRPDGPTDRESDLYAATKVCYQMFTGADVSSFPELPSDLARTSSVKAFRGLSDFLDRGCSSNSARRFSSAEAMIRHFESWCESGSAFTAGSGSARRRGLDRWAAPITIGGLLVALVLTLWFTVWNPSVDTPPSAQLIVTTYPDSGENPNFISRDDPGGLLARYARTISTNIPQPKAPPEPIRFAKAHVVSEPASYVAVFWITPRTPLVMNFSENAQKNFYDPLLDLYVRLSGYDGNCVICAVVSRRPFANPGKLRQLVTAVVEQGPDTPLPIGTMLILGADQKTPTYVSSDNSVREDMGLLGRIRAQLGGTYTVVGVELPLPSQLHAPPTARDTPSEQHSQPSNSPPNGT